MAKVLGFSINIQGTERAVETAEELRREIQALQKVLKQTEDVQSIKILEKQLIDLKASQQDVNAQIREEIKLRRTELNAVDDTTGAYAKMSKTLNEQRKRYKDLAAAGQQFTKEALDIRTEVTQLDGRLKEIDASVGQFQRNVGGYSQALSQFFPRISQTFGDVTAGFQSTAGAAGTLNKSLGFLLLAVTVFNEISAGIQQAAEASKEFNAVSKRLTQITNQNTDALQDNTGTIIALSRTYQQESNEILNAANTVAKEFGIEYSEALTLIEAGFRRGSDAQGQFLDQLREYPTQAAAAGVSAVQFFSILETAANEGIYADTLVDAVKEFGLRINKQVKPTRDALQNAFGQDFTNKLLRDVDTGAITAFQALQKVSKGLKDVNLSASQAQGVVTDVFGGPGENAGLRAIQLLADIDDGLKDVTKSTNEYESQQYQLFEANEELAQSQARLAEATVKTGNEFKLLQVGFKAFIADAAVGVLEFFNRLPATLAGAQAGVKAFSSSLRAIATFGIAGDITNPFEAYNEAYKEVLKKIKEQDRIAEEEAKKEGERRVNTEAGIQQRLSQLRAQRAQAQIGSAEFKALDKEIKALEGKLKEAGGKGAKAFIDGSIAALQQKANALQKAIGEAVAGSEAQAKLIAAYKVQEGLLEKAIEERNRLELSAVREQQKRVIGELKTFYKAALQSTAEAVVLSLASKQFAPAEKAFINDRIEFATTLLDTVKGINFKGAKQDVKDYQEKLEELNEVDRAAFFARKDAILANIEQGTQLTFDLINTLAAAANQRRNEVFAQQISDTEARIAELEEKAGRATGIRKRLFEQSAAQEKKVLAEQTKNAEAEQKRQRKAEKRNAIISSIIQGALAVQRALAAFPFPPASIPQAVATGIFAALQTATIAAQPLATGGIAGISGRRVNDRQNIRTRGNGDNVLATVKRGEVILNQRQQQALGGSQTFRSIRVPGFASGGIASPAMGAPRLPASAADSLKAIEALDRKTDAINARLDRLRAFVVTEDIARDMDDAQSIQIKASL